MNSFYSSPCPLCEGACELFYVGRKEARYYLCSDCRGIHLAGEYWLSAEEEKKHYLTHNNDVQDLRYRTFVAPVVDAILSEQPRRSLGLDYGAGSGPVISRMLEEAGYTTRLFDPFFHPDPLPLEQRYAYIVCTEVIEHFQQPREEFARLASMLEPRGVLYCMTELVHPGIDFGSWRYKNDPTHVFFYQVATLEWIAAHFDFLPVEVEGRRIIFRKR